ncbi:hypothetical protein [Polluticoccus soli]|uniref:hypothetical protein n=1 Tax=Polluticoccus soli TaxID=3034150 RepID=UPI0023E166A0|nr:hypothetical protein [Flavipsychrobacter sp. JY13-12]
MRRLFATLLLLISVCFNVARATSWSPVHPYKVFSSETDIVVDAVPYNPYAWEPSLGETRVYSAGQLLYKIDRYFDAPVFASNDGKYLAVVYSATDSHRGTPAEVRDHSGIEIYENGKLYHRYSMPEIIGKVPFPEEGAFEWSYYVDWPEEMRTGVQFGCEACRETWSEQVLASCDTSEIDNDDCAECRSACDSFSLYQRLKQVEENAISMRGDTLRILTKLGMILEVHLSSKQEMTRRRVFDQSKMEILPASTRRKDTKEIDWPGIMDLPQLVNGDSIEIELGKLFTNLGRYNANEKLGVHITSMVIDSSGRCEFSEIYFMTEDKDWDKHFYKYSAKQVRSIIKEWIKKQRFDTSLMPSGFKKYSFESYIDI